MSSDLDMSYSPFTPPSTPGEKSPRSPGERSSGASSNAFYRWRPSYHLMAASGWLNDPCAPGFDPDTGLYHVFFQWNPKGNDWGDISWGHATSTDLLTWDVSREPSLVPDMPYDSCGIFTGCFLKAKAGHGKPACLTLAYTSVNILPIHHTLQYTHGCESLSLATSHDDGATWQKYAENPVLPCAPTDLAVTGWRDPFVASWPSMSRLLGHNTDEVLYGIVSGGIAGRTPTTFIYTVDASDFSKWTYLGPLTDVGLNLRPSRWSGDLGQNWEVTNFLSLYDHDDDDDDDDDDTRVSRDFLVMGTEGCLPSAISSVPTVLGALERVPRSQLWMAGTLERKSSAEDGTAVKPRMRYDFGGHLDHGCYYAANSFYDPNTHSHTVWGWIVEDDLCDDLRQGQGWSGLLSLPRALRMQTIRHVTHAWSTPLSSITSIEAAMEAGGTYTVRTLASSPVKRVVEQLRCGPGVRLSELQDLHINSTSQTAAFAAKDLQSRQWELDCSLSLSKSCQQVGLTIGHAADLSVSTTLSFVPDSETFTISRPSFNSPESATQINSCPEVAPHTLFTVRDPVTGVEATETLNIRVWRDNSVLEVFVNERTAISTRLYGGEDNYGVEFFADDGVVDQLTGTKVILAQLWDGIGVSSAKQTNGVDT